jgi:outer membrane protein OmpA-like peptidoglycan-associated protein
MQIKIAAWILSFLTLWIPAAAKAQSGSPLSRSVDSAVRGCAPMSTLKVPLITWGGDIPTILANGMQRSTSAKSLFGAQGLQVSLAREDVFAKQLEAYLTCESPFLRGTLGMIHMASEVTERDPRTKLNVIYQLTWSSGGDALVVKEGIKTARDLKGKRIAIQEYGPHVEYLGKVLADAGLTFKDVQLRWVRDLTGSEATPGVALRDAEVHAAMVIIPDALALTSGGSVGTGAESSVRGASILLSTKSANRVIADVYAVRQDFFEAQRATVQKFVLALMQAEEQASEIMSAKQTRPAEYNSLMTAAADLLLDSPQAIPDAEGLYADAEFVGWKGNVNFFTSDSYPRRFQTLSSELKSSFATLGLVQNPSSVGWARWDFNLMKEGLRDTAGVEAPRFVQSEVQRVVAKKQQQGTLADSGLFTFEVFFKPNQNEFSASLYQEAFDRAINLASTYGGAIITVEGHSDPLGYLQKKQGGAPEVALRQIQQSAKNLSLGRANAVRDALVSYAKSKGVILDPSQFAVIGYGIERPKSGLCGQLPCPPKTEQEWLDNMRVEFRLIQIEAETSVFNPL